MRILLIFALFIFSSAFAEPTLEHGSPAPQLKIEKWLKGTPVEKFEPGRIYIVEFWATWCGPCLTSIPHLSEIAKKYGNDITVIGIAADQDDKDAAKGLAEVEEFLKKNDPAMEYTVAFDSTGETKKLWMEAASKRGIPSAFIVDRNGVISYIGHPMNMEEDEIDNPLKLVLDGTWQKSEKLAKYHADEKAEAAIEDRYIELIGKMSDALKKEDWVATYNWAAQGAWLPQPHSSPFILQKAKMLIAHLGRPESGFQYLKELVDNSWNNVQTMGHVLRLLVHDNMPKELRDKDLGERVAQRTLDLATNHPDKSMREKLLRYSWMLLPSVAEYYFKEGRADLAVDLQTSALKTLPDDEKHAEEKAELEKDLSVYSEVFEKSKKIVATSNEAAPTAMVCEGGVCYIPKDCAEKLN